MATRGPQRSYDHRLRERVRETGDPRIAVKLGVPRSTAAGWARSAKRPVLTVTGSEPAAETALRSEVARLRLRVARLTALLRVLFALLHVFEFDLSHRRLVLDASKRRLVRAIDGTSAGLALGKVLRLIGLSSSRFHAWKRGFAGCALDDRKSCPKSTPQRLTAEEVRAVREMVGSDEYRHVPTGSLARLAQRLGRVFASATTWHRLVRENGWRRPRTRVHPRKPTVGIRANAADEIWHIDTTVIRLVNGLHVYLHAVIDNFSRRILAWKVASKFDPLSTVEILERAAAGRNGQGSPMVMADAGVENCNHHVDTFLATGALRRVIARTQLMFSNSMIEAFWRTLKHQWLFLHRLENERQVEKLAGFYVTEHNAKIPHAAFRGETPDEMYFGKAGDVAADLKTRRAEARTARLAANRAARCDACADPANKLADNAA
jgi:putative transposase